jgi:molecular chaperone DnaJ
MNKLYSLYFKNGCSSRILKNPVLQSNLLNQKIYTNSFKNNFSRPNYSTKEASSKNFNSDDNRKNTKFNYFPFRNFSFFKKTSIKNRVRNYNFYEVLGIDKTCTNEQIRAAYLKLAKQYHPDVNKDPGSDDKFKTLTLAYEALSNQRNRDLYDAYMDNDPYSQDWKYKEEMWKEDGGNSAKNFYKERAKYDKYSQDYKHQSDSNFWQGGREDFTNQFYKDFDNIFTGGAGGSAYNKPKKDQKGEDILLEIKINLEESYFGCEKGVKFSKVDKCKTCHGHRSAPGHRPSKCFTCNGVGEIKTSMFNSKKCNQCKGVGVIIKHPCK